MTEVPALRECADRLDCDCSSSHVVRARFIRPHPPLSSTFLASERSACNNLRLLFPFSLCLSDRRELSKKKSVAKLFGPTVARWSLFMSLPPFWLKVTFSTFRVATASGCLGLAHLQSYWGDPFQRDKPASPQDAYFAEYLF